MKFYYERENHVYFWNFHKKGPNVRKKDQKGTNFPQKSLKGTKVPLEGPTWPQEPPYFFYRSDKENHQPGKMNLRFDKVFIYIQKFQVDHLT